MARQRRVSVLLSLEPCLLHVSLYLKYSLPPITSGGKLQDTNASGSEGEPQAALPQGLRELFPRTNALRELGASATLVGERAGLEPWF